LLAVQETLWPYANLVIHTDRGIGMSRCSCTAYIVTNLYVHISTGLLLNCQLHLCVLFCRSTEAAELVVTEDSQLIPFQSLREGLPYSRCNKAVPCSVPLSPCCETCLMLIHSAVTKSLHCWVMQVVRTSFSSADLRPRGRLCCWCHC
jgi:hypothetical protein